MTALFLCGIEEMRWDGAGDLEICLVQIWISYRTKQYLELEDWARQGDIER